MCNNYANHISLDAYVAAFSDFKVPVRFPRASPNLEPRDSIRPTDVAPVIRTTEAGAEFAQLSWGLPPSRPKAPPIINFRSEGRTFKTGRCLIPASAFYEFTGTTYPKTRWRFRKADAPWFAIAGLWRPVGERGAFTMLTCAPGTDVAPYHDRQIVILEQRDWATWLDFEPPRVSRRLQLLRGWSHDEANSPVFS